MIFADKLIDLRKKNGWSQEELAEKLNVSRQAVSKWEGAQSIPDMIGSGQRRPGPGRRAGRSRPDHWHGGSQCLPED